MFTNLAFFPLLPGIMALFLAIGINPFVGALVVANLAFLGVLVAFRALTAPRADAATTTRAVWALALLPTAVYCSMAYTESIALLCAVLAALAAVRGRYLLAGLVAAVGSLSRPTGILVVVLIGLLALQSSPDLAVRLTTRRADRGAQRDRPRRLPGLDGRRARLGTAAVPGAEGLGPGSAGHRPGDLGAPTRSARAGTTSSTAPAARRGTRRSATWCSWRWPCGWSPASGAREGGLRSPWVAYSVVVLAVPLSSGTITSMARFALMAFPLMWPLADWLGDDAAARAVGRRRSPCPVTVLLVLQLLMRSP